MQEEGATGHLFFNTRTPSWPTDLYQTLFRAGFLLYRKESPGGHTPVRGLTSLSRPAD